MHFISWTTISYNPGTILGIEVFSNLFSLKQKDPKEHIFHQLLLFPTLSLLQKYFVDELVS